MDDRHNGFPGLLSNPNHVHGAYRLHGRGQNRCFLSPYRFRHKISFGLYFRLSYDEQPSCWDARWLEAQDGALFPSSLSIVTVKSKSARRGSASLSSAAGRKARSFAVPRARRGTDPSPCPSIPHPRIQFHAFLARGQTVLARGQTEFQVNLKLGLTPRRRTPRRRTPRRRGGR